MVATTSSTFETATASPHRTWLRSRALFSSNAVRRVTTSSRKATKCGEEIAQRQLLGPAAVERQHVAAERGLHRREAEKLVEHHLGRRVALQFDHHAHADAVGFVGDVADALDLLLAHRVGDAFDHGRLVHLVGDLVDDDRVAVLAHLLDMGAGADDDRAAPLQIGLARARPAEDQRPGGKVGGRDVLHQLFAGQVQGSRSAPGSRRHLAQDCAAECWSPCRRRCRRRR
jgi:hypothetical protein